jgi:hypothetical protein
MATRILLNGLSWLDVDDNTDIASSFAVSSISDVTAKTASSTKSIKIINSKETQKVLGQLFDVNIRINDASFNVNKKVPAILYQNDFPVLKGYFQLRNITVKSPSDISNYESVTYEGYVFQDVVSFFEKLDKSELTDLDFSNFNHTFSLSAVTDSFDNTYLDGYTYPWHYTPASAYNLNAFRPGIYAKNIWDSIFASQGYSYESDFLNSEPFTKLIIPYTGKDLEISQQEKEAREFRVSVASATTVVIPGYIGICPNNIPLTLTTGVAHPFNTETEGIDFDGSRNNFDTTLNTFTVKANGNYEFDTKVSGTFTITSVQNAAFISQLNNFSNSAPSFQVSLVPILNGTDELPGAVSPSFTVTPSYVAGQTYSYSWVVQSSGMAFDFNVGDTITMELRITFNGTNIFKTPLPPPPLVPSDMADILLTATVVTAYSDTDNFWKSSTKKTAQPLQVGDIVNMNDIIPGKVKQRDFISYFSDKFFLYFQPDPENPNRLKINPYTEFYSQSANTYVDWSDKMAYELPYTIELLSQLNEKTFDFTDKMDDKDYMLSDYLKRTGFNYGEFQVTFNNDFTRGTKVIGNKLFSPTPLVKSLAPVSSSTIADNGLIVSYLTPGIEQNLRLLYHGGGIQCAPYTLNYVDDLGVQQTTTLTNYNYAGHFDNPLNCNFDLNWNTNEFYYYNSINSGITNNNTYNRYWFDYVNMIAESRVLTAYFNLSEFDIFDLSFQRKVFIEGLNSYWYIVKVSDYSAGKNTLTKVELIQALDVPKFSKKKVTRTRLFTDLQTIQIPLGDLGYIDDGIISNNSNAGSFSSLHGIGNNLGYYSNEVEILGDNNAIGINGVRMRVNGNSNRVGPNALQVVINGDNNILGNDVRSVTINSNNCFLGSNIYSVTLDNSDNSNIESGNRYITFNNTTNSTIQASTEQVGIYNSDAIIVQPGCTNIFVANSSGITIQSGLTNVNVIGAYNLTITNSNSAYGVITGTTGSGNFLPISGGTLTGPVVGTTFTGTFIGDGSGLSGLTDVYITGATFSAGTLNLQNSTGGTVTAVGDFPWEFVQTGQTVGAVNINLCNYFVGSSNNCYNVKGYVSGINTSGSRVYGAEMYGVIKSTGTTFFQVGKIINTKTSEFSSADSTISFASSASTIFLTCIGQTAETINWRANLKIY